MQNYTVKVKNESHYLNESHSLGQIEQDDDEGDQEDGDVQALAAQDDEKYLPETEILFAYEVVRHGARAPLSAVPLNGQLKMSDHQKKKTDKKARKAQRREEKRKKAEASGQPIPERKKKHHHSHSQQLLSRRQNDFNSTKFMLH